MRTDDNHTGDNPGFERQKNFAALPDLFDRKPARRRCNGGKARVDIDGFQQSSNRSIVPAICNVGNNLWHEATLSPETAQRTIFYYVNGLTVDTHAGNKRRMKNSFAAALLFAALLGSSQCKEKTVAAPEGPQKLYVFAEPSLALREQGTESAKEIAAIAFGEAVMVEQTTGKEETLGGKTGVWAKAQHQGKSGYVFTGLLSPVSLPQATCKNLLDYARTAFTAEGQEVRSYDDPGGKGPYRWTQKFAGNITAEGYGTIDNGAMTLVLPVKDSEIGFQICKRCTPFFRSLTYSSFRQQNETIKECGGRTKLGGCLTIWTIETAAAENGLTVKCGPESI